uniref:CUB-like domain-containing protein n=1 Tax=Plectus sambesii TaxID=2011161 RepID=A0A914VBW2_9BILA
MIQNLIASFVVAFGLFWQTFADSTAAAVSTDEKLAIDIKNIQQTDNGFNAQTNTSNCKCPDNVDLNKSNPNGEIEYNKLDSTTSFVCCTNCVSVISAPPGYQVEVTKSYLQFYNDSKASLTIRNGNGNGGYVLGKFDNKKEKTATFLVSAVNAMTVTFNTVNTASTCRKVFYYIGARLKKLPTPSPTSHSLSSDQPFYLITNKDLSSSKQYWTITAETGKQVHLYLYGDLSNWFKGNIFVIDGTDVNGTIISQAGQSSVLSNGPLNAISSSGGSLTILLDFRQYSYFAGVNLLFTQLENDPFECGTSKLVFLTTDSSPATNVQISNNGGGTASCPAVLIAYSHYSSYPGMQLNVSSLQGSMVLYGGVDYQQSSNNEIIRFSSMDDVISPVKVAGKVFVVLLAPGSVINLNFQWSSSQSSYSVNGGSGGKGLVMSENFPYPNTNLIKTGFSFYGSGNDHYEYSITVLRYDLGNNGSLNIRSTYSDSDFSKTLTSNGVNNTLMQFCAYSFRVEHNSNGVGQKGFVLRYDVGKTCSRGLSAAWICIIAVAATVVIAVAASLITSSWKRSKLRSQLNNTNSTVQPVHYVPSQPDKRGVPPSYEEAMVHSTPTALTYSNRWASVITPHA